MAKKITEKTGGHRSPFEKIKRTNDAGTEFWSSREFARVLGYGDYRNFEGVVEKAKLACFNNGHRIEDHFVEVTEMVEIGSGGHGFVASGYEVSGHFGTDIDILIGMTLRFVD